MDWIDEQLGKITMYRLVLYSLVSLVVLGIVLAALGRFSFSPLSLFMSATLFAAVSYGANRLFGWLFGLQPHAESALITGLILALLFTPPTALIGFTKLLIVAVIAQASKYILAIRGRHVFNPAAVAVVIASVSGLAFAGWWVATPPMIPLTLFVGFLILRRTKKQFVSLLFVVTSVIMLFIQGTNPVTALVSWPLLFVAVVMLTEPLTLPPRAYQQYIVAVVVGVLTTLPFHYGRITMTPALALVIGNIIGWWYGQRRIIKLRYVGKKQMGSHSYDFTFDTDPLKFEPGQYIEISVPHAHADSRGLRRVFSIASRPNDEQLSIGTHIPERPSSFKRALMNLKPGQIIYATRIAGDFVLPKDKNTPIVCIASGIGVTPFMSFLLSSHRRMHVIYSAKTVSDLSYVDQLKQHSSEITVISPDAVSLPDPEWRHVKGRVNKDTLLKLVDITAQPTVYVSGPPMTVVHIRRMLKDIGIKKIKIDEFSGY